MIVANTVDIFPATIVLLPADNAMAASALSPASPVSDGVNLNTIRLVVMGGQVLLAQDSPSGPQVVFSEAVDMDSLHKDSSGGYLTTVSGRKLAWNKDSSCGCGSRLRSWRPYKHVGSTSTPTE